MPRPIPAHDVLAKPGRSILDRSQLPLVQATHSLFEVWSLLLAFDSMTMPYSYLLVSSVMCRRLQHPDGGLRPQVGLTLGRAGLQYCLVIRAVSRTLVVVISRWRSLRLGGYVE